MRQGLNKAILAALINFDWGLKNEKITFERVFHCTDNVTQIVTKRYTV